MRALLLGCLLFMGCEIPETLSDKAYRLRMEADFADPQTNDQCERARIMEACLKALPVGPTNVVSNDWSEIVEQCAEHAKATSIRRQSTVEPKCRSN